MIFSCGLKVIYRSSIEIDRMWNFEHCVTSIYVDSIQLSIKLKDTVCKLMRFHLNARNEWSVGRKSNDLSILGSTAAKKRMSV